MESVEKSLAHISLMADDSDKENKDLQDCSLQNKLVDHNSTPGDHVQKRLSGSDSSHGTKSESVSTPGSTDRERFMALIGKARRYAGAGNISRALELNRRALALHYNERLEKRIRKMENFLAEEDEDEETLELGEGFHLARGLLGKLYAHQRVGVLWLWSLHCKGKGGILADDMGLGKTIQVIAYLAGMFAMGKIKSVLIVLPLSMMVVWVKEFSKWAPDIDVLEFHGGSKRDRQRALLRVQTRGGVLLTTYGLIVTQQDMLRLRNGRDFEWDYAILDEGHKIKNPTKTSRSIHGIPAKMRIILTGTPVQNNLKELWALYDYVHDGSLLGTLRTFKMEFEGPITRARERDASNVAKRLGEKMSEALKAIIQPYFLRRTKADVKNAPATENAAQMPSMTRKNDFVIWLFLSDVQKKIYEDFTNLDDIKELLMTKKSPLVALTVLKKICDHPRLLSTRACLKLGLDGKNFDEEELEKASSYESAATQIENIANDVLVSEAGKMGVLVDLLKVFKEEGHKCLVFSQSRKLLDIIQKILVGRGHKVARLDGTVTHTSDREDIVCKFQRDPTCFVFLLTIQVGGVGLTITSADRVVIYDPSWNPAVDAQAVDRAYRIGQDRNVVVYRLITCGTVEEKIYRRQVFKDSITQQTTGGASNPYRYFTKTELKELFVLDDTHFSTTQRQLQDMHSDQRITDPDLDTHLAFLHTLDIFGISDHDLMFKQIEIRDDEMEDEHPALGHAHYNETDFIQGKIQQAQALIAQESNNNFTYEQRNKTAKTFSSTLTSHRLDTNDVAGKEAERLLEAARRLDGTETNAPPQSYSRIIDVSAYESDEDEDHSDDAALPSQPPFGNVHSNSAESPIQLSEEEEDVDGQSKNGCSFVKKEENSSPEKSFKIKEEKEEPVTTDPGRPSHGVFFHVPDSPVQSSPPAKKADAKLFDVKEEEVEEEESLLARSEPIWEMSGDLEDGPILVADSCGSDDDDNDGDDDVAGLSNDSDESTEGKMFGREQPYDVIADSFREDDANEDIDSDQDDENENAVANTNDGHGDVDDNENDENDVQGESDDAETENDEDDNDDENEEIFQELISVARALYKSKEYEESLKYVEKALTIFQEPGLEEMAAKIRMRIQSS